MKVKDIGMKEIYYAKPSASLSEVAALMKRHNVGAIPVCDDGNFLGIITDRDLVIGCMAADMAPDKCQAKEFMTSSTVSVGTDTDLEEAARIMGREQIHRLPVMEGDKLVGIVSLGDISTTLQDDKLVAETLRKISEPA